MSVCGDCPYPYEAKLEDPELTQEEICSLGCFHEDAAYRAQWSYDRLMERYKELEKKYEDLLKKEWSEEEWK